jgi:RNA polymerase sigma-70 factor (ECF subfamily)
MKSNAEGDPGEPGTAAETRAARDTGLARETNVNGCDPEPRPIKTPFLVAAASGAMAGSISGPIIGSNGGLAGIREQPFATGPPAALMLRPSGDGAMPGSNRAPPGAVWLSGAPEDLAEPDPESLPVEMGGTPAISPQDAAAYADWAALVERIRSGETDGMEELYTLFSKGVRFYLCRQLGPQELDDKVHDTFVVVVQAIRRGELRDPQRLMGFVRTIVRRQVAAHIDRVVHLRREQIDMESTVRIADPHGNPEEAAIFRQRTALIGRVLSELSDRDREILTRFYLREQSQYQICTEMALTETQFRLLKSRAKARFGEIGKKKIAHKALGTVLVRTSAGLSH